MPGEGDARQPEVPRRAVPRGEDEVVDEHDRPQPEPDERVEVPPDHGRRRRARATRRRRRVRAYRASHGDEDHRGQARGEDVELPSAIMSPDRPRPAEEMPAGARQAPRRPAGSPAPRAAATNASGTSEQEGEQAELVRGRAVPAAGEEEEQFGRPAAAVEDGRLRVSGLELRVVAGGGAAVAEGAGPERAVVEVERVPAGEDRAGRR